MFLWHWQWCRRWDSKSHWHLQCLRISMTIVGAWAWTTAHTLALTCSVLFATAVPINETPIVAVALKSGLAKQVRKSPVIYLNVIPAESTWPKGCRLVLPNGIQCVFAKVHIPDQQVRFSFDLNFYHCKHFVLISLLYRRDFL